MEEKMVVKSRKPRVLMFGPDLDATSGISNVVNNWLEVGLRGKVDLKYISTLKHYVPGRIFFKAIEAMSTYFQLFKVSTNTFDIVHIHFSTGMSFYRKLIVFKLAKLKGFKIVIHLHGSNFKQFYQNGNDFKKKLIEKFFNEADAVLVLAKSWQSFCEQFCNKGNIRIIYNGASVDKFNSKINHRVNLNISFMGRLGQRKGIYDLLEAFEKLSSDIPNAKLVLGGDGDIDLVKKIIKEKNIENRIDILGWVTGKQKIEVFQKTDIYVLPSYNEGMPGSVLEAMAAGVPIISTPVGAIPEIVIENKNGYLIKPGDINELYSKLKLLSQNKNLRERMGKESKRIIQEKFDVEKIVNKLLKIYEEILE